MDARPVQLRPWRSLGLIVALHLGLGLAFSLATPLFEAPDEANHFLFIRHLQIYRALPVQTLDQDGPRAHHPPLYFLLGALATAWVPQSGGAEHIGLPESGGFWFRYGDVGLERKAKYLHSAAERPPYHDTALAAHIVRLLSTASSTLAVIATYALALETRPGDRAFAGLAAALLAFNPMVLFMSGVVQNSTAALASAAAVLYALARGLRTRFTPARWAVLGGLFSAAALLQTSSLALAAPVAAALAWDAWRARSWRRFLAGGLAFALPVLALTGWWFWRNQALYGDWTANAIVGALWSDQPVMPAEQTLHLLLTGLVGRFGFGLIIEYADPVYRACWLLAGLALVGLVVAAGRPRPDRAPADDARPAAAIWGMHGITVLAVTAALAYYIIGFIRGGHGRYLFTAYPSLAVLLAAGALAWFPARWRSWAAGALGAASLALSAYGLFGLVIPAYAPPRPPTPAELQAMSPLDAEIAGTVRVLAYQLDAVTVQPGQALEVHVIWEPLSRTDVPYTVFVHLLDPTLGSLAQVDLYPGAGNWATTVWEVGRPFVDVYRLAVPADAPALEGARLVLGLYNAETMQRLPVTGRDAGAPDEAWVQFGAVTIAP